MKKLFLLTFFAWSTCVTMAQSTSTELYPASWWIGMKWNTVQILVRNPSDEFNKQEVSINYPGVVLRKTTRLENPHYYALDVEVSASALAGQVPISFTNNKKKTTVAYWPIEKRREGNGTAFAQGVRSEDVMYLIMPDRFSNGDKSNDKVAGMRDQSLRRDTVYERHGGDLQGVINHLDYLKDMGVTALWMTPIWENDMPSRTEHGYAITNHYKVDPRLGSNEKYKQLSDELHKRNMKLVQDVVYNHVGIMHTTVLDKPCRDWLHEWPEFTQTTYKDQVAFDSHAAPSDKKIMEQGWFVRDMPDLNQNNPYVANYLIQQALWTAENFGVDGWRIDTYLYNDLEFMNRCNKALYDEYPRMTIFGETWVHGVINQSYFCENNMSVPFKSNLQSTTDFQTLFYGIQPALTEKFGWTDGVNKLYTTTAQDILYKDPMQQVIFLDNHDIARFYSVLGEDVKKYKVALSWLLTFRGVPQMYYGMETLMTGFTNPDGYVRQDFPGGWEGDIQNKFTAAGRTEKENDVFNHIRTLANFRKSSSAITHGKLMQYVPVDGVYTYFRYDDSQSVVCIMNTGEKAKTINLQELYKDRTLGFSTTKDVLTGKSSAMIITVQPMEMYVGEMGH